MLCILCNFFFPAKLFGFYFFCRLFTRFLPVSLLVSFIYVNLVKQDKQGHLIFAIFCLSCRIFSCPFLRCSCCAFSLVQCRAVPCPEGARRGKKGRRANLRLAKYVCEGARRCGARRAPLAQVMVSRGK